MRNTELNTMLLLSQGDYSDVHCEFPKGRYILTSALPSLTLPGEDFLREVRVNAASHKQVRIIYFKTLESSLAGKQIF